MSKPERLVLYIQPDGSIEMLHNDTLKFRRLGRRQVRRASHVEFNERDQVWEAHDAVAGFVIARHQDREECIRLEAEYYDRLLNDGYRPFSRTTRFLRWCSGRFQRFVRLTRPLARTGRNRVMD